jgi:uncharacterized protein
MKEGLQQLLELQEADKELQALEEAKAYYPDEISTRRQKIAEGQKKLDEQQHRLEELSKNQRHLDRELEATKIDTKEHENRFAVVSTNKEYDALQREIEACKIKIADYETQILETIQQRETLEQQLEVETQAFEDMRQTQQQRIDELEEKLSTIQQQLDSMQSRRQAHTSQIAPALLEIYERNRKPRGVRVTAIRKGACGNCFRELPTQQRSNVRRNQELYYCENCGVILVWDDQSN